MQVQIQEPPFSPALCIESSAQRMHLIYASCKYVPTSSSIASSILQCSEKGILDIQESRGSHSRSPILKSSSGTVRTCVFHTPQNGEAFMMSSFLFMVSIIRMQKEFEGRWTDNPHRLPPRPNSSQFFGTSRKEARA